MGHTWTDEDPQPNGEHPIVALIAVVAIILAIVLIAWAKLEVHGTGELEAALTEPGHAPEPPPEHARTKEERAVDEAVTSSRFATGFSP